MKSVASLRYGVIFKKAFSEPAVFKAFVRDFLGVKLEIERVETEKAFPEAVGKVASRFDLFAEDTKNRIIVDIQHVRHADHYHRFLHYHCAAILEQAANFGEYRPPLTVFTLVVLTSGDKHQTDVAVVDFDPKTLQGGCLNEISHKILYICPKYVNAQTPEPFREWMRAIDDSLDGEVDETRYSRPEVLKIFDLIAQDGLSPEERARILDERREEDYGAEKFAKGMEKGLEQGLGQGVEQGLGQAAKAMLREGMEVALICKITGLPEAEILSLQAQSDDK